MSNVKIHSAHLLFNWFNIESVKFIHTPKVRQSLITSYHLQKIQKSIPQTDYWTDYWVGEVCRQIQTSPWKPPTKALYPQDFTESFDVWLGGFLQIHFRKKKRFPPKPFYPFWLGCFLQIHFRKRHSFHQSPLSSRFYRIICQDWRLIRSVSSNSLLEKKEVYSTRKILETHI